MRSPNAPGNTFRGVAPKAKGKRYSHRWKRGDRVRVLGGPFEGHGGTVKRAHNKTCLEVEFVLCDRAQDIVLEHRALETAACGFA